MPGACGRACSHADQFHPGAARRSGHRRIGKNPARLRALRLLHRHLPDLRARRQRARFAARAHLPDQGHAGARPAGDRGRRRAHRPLPVVPCLHDDLSVGRALHASGRPCPRAYRKHLSTARRPSACCARCWPGCCPIRSGSGWRCWRRSPAKPLAPLLDAIGLKRLAAMLRLAPWRGPQRPLAAADLSGRGCAQGPRRPARRLRQRRDGAADQRRDHRAC